MTETVPAGHVQVKRAYEAPAKEDGKRVLVDRVWPRGVKKEALKLESWAKEVAPTTELRRWFGHDPEKWPEFRKRYREELRDDAHREALDSIRALAGAGCVTLVYSARDEAHNQALVIRELLVEG